MFLKIVPVVLVVLVVPAIKKVNRKYLCCSNLKKRMGNFRSNPSSFQRLNDFTSDRRKTADILQATTTEEINASLRNNELFEKSNDLLYFTSDKFVLYENDLRFKYITVLRNELLRNSQTLVYVEFKENARFHLPSGICWIPQTPAIFYYTFATDSLDLWAFSVDIASKLVNLGKNNTGWQNVIAQIKSIKFVVSKKNA